MMTVKEVSTLTGVSIRTLHYYDEIGLLSPAVTTTAGYRLYDEASLQRLQQIMLYRELEFPLRDIRTMMDSPSFDRDRALSQQIELLKLRRERLDRLIDFAHHIRKNGGSSVSYKAFDRKKQEQYAAEAKKSWGGTEAYQAYDKKRAGRSEAEEQALGEGLMAIFAELGRIRDKGPAAPEAQALIEKLQRYISANYYPCSKEILASLGEMYSAGGEMTENIDAAGEAGTAAFATEAIRVFCK